MIEIVPFAEAEHIDRVAEMMPAPQPWPAAAEIAAASVAPLAGESAQPAPEPALVGEAREEPEEAAAAVPTAETEMGIPFASPAERVLEEAVAQASAVHRGEPARAAPAPLPEDEVPPASEPPANPRRGWWQRLTQS